jgi:hypothetical protein
METMLNERFKEWLTTRGTPFFTTVLKNEFCFVISYSYEPKKRKKYVYDYQFLRDMKDRSDNQIPKCSSHDTMDLARQNLSPESITQDLVNFLNEVHASNTTTSKESSYLTIAFEKSFTSELHLSIKSYEYSTAGLISDVMKRYLSYKFSE